MMTEVVIRIADWQNPHDRAVLRNIRQKVFIDEQHVPVELEWDEFDATSAHFIALVDGRPVAVARLKTDGQLGRMAVLAEHRGKHIGTAVLEFVLQHAKSQDIGELYCHAQVSALDFYRRHGFNEYGDEFSDAGIPHHAMSIKLE